MTRPWDLSDLGEPLRTLEQTRKGVHDRILNQTTATLSVTWTVGDSLDESASEMYYRDLVYRLTFTKGGISVVYSGKVDLHFTDDGTGSWYISKWVDKRDGSGQPDLGMAARA